MATLPGDRVPRDSSAPARSALLALLVSTQAADAATTAAGLWLVPSLVERNPALVLLIGEVGPGVALALGSAFVLACVVLVTEVGCVVVRGFEGSTLRSVLVVRVVGYVPFSLVSWALAVNNAALVGSTL